MRDPKKTFAVVEMLVQSVQLGGQAVEPLKDRVQLVESGAGARERLLAELGPETAVAASREDLVRISESGGEKS